MSILKSLEPFNIDLLTVDDRYVSDYRLDAISDPAIMDSSGSRYAEKGLYSNEIFGLPGTPERNSIFGYIPLNVPIMHPELYRNLIKLKKLYDDVFAGKEYGTLKDNDIVKATLLDGDTGYQFMVESISEMKLSSRDSAQRDFILRLLDKYKDDMFTTTNLLVLPAGLREYEVSKSGKPTEHEINSYYRKIMATAGLINPDIVRNDIRSVNGLRYRLQKQVNELYLYYLDFLANKWGFIYKKFVRRNTFNTTRNVLSSTSIRIKKLGDKNNVDANSTIKGLFQTCVDLMPILQYQLQIGVIGQALPGAGIPSQLIRKDDLKLEEVEVSSAEYEKWSSLSGFGKALSKFKQEETRTKPVEIHDHYVALIYLGKDNTYKVFRDITTIPASIDKSLIYPINYAELYYTAIYGVVARYPMLFTRFPVTLEGSIYPSFTHLITTIPFEKRVELDDAWLRTDKEATSFPIRGKRFLNSMTPHHIHLSRLGADFDGDQGSSQSLYTEESIAEINDYLSKPESYISPTGELLYSASTDVSEYALAYALKGLD